MRSLVTAAVESHVTTSQADSQIMFAFMLIITTFMDKQIKEKKKINALSVIQLRQNLQISSGSSGTVQ